MNEEVLGRRKEITKALKINERLVAGEGFDGFKNDERLWGVYDSSLIHFSVNLLSSLPYEEQKKRLLNTREESEIFRKYIEETLSKEGRNNLTAVEFGGPGSMLFKGFTEKFFRQTIGVCLQDIREKIQREEDEKINHSIITGNILEVQNTELITNILENLNVTKIDLIISRMMGPLDHIDKNTAILDRLIRNWYSILNENGLMFIQFEIDKYTKLQKNENLEEKICNWSMRVKEIYPEIDITVNNGVMRLHKKTGAPEKLPPATQLFKQEQ